MHLSGGCDRDVKGQIQNRVEPADLAYESLRRRLRAAFVARTWFTVECMPPDEPTPDLEAQVDSYFDRYESHLADIGRAARSNLRDRLPGFFEVVYVYGNQDALVIAYSPTERGYEGLFTLRVDPRGVKLYFAKSPELSNADAAKLLKGRAKAVRYVDLSSVGGHRARDIEELIEASLKVANVRLDPSAKGAVIIKAAARPVT